MLSEAFPSKMVDDGRSARNLTEVARARPSAGGFAARLSPSVQLGPGLHARQEVPERAGQFFAGLDGLTLILA